MGEGVGEEERACERAGPLVFFVIALYSCTVQRVSGDARGATRRDRQRVERSSEHIEMT
jgi:hypothetical protein